MEEVLAHESAVGGDDDDHHHDSSIPASGVYNSVNIASFTDDSTTFVDHGCYMRNRRRQVQVADTMRSNATLGGECSKQERTVYRIKNNSFARFMGWITSYYTSGIFAILFAFTILFVCLALVWMTGFWAWPDFGHSVHKRDFGGSVFAIQFLVAMFGHQIVMGDLSSFDIGPTKYSEWLASLAIFSTQLVSSLIAHIDLVMRDAGYDDEVRKSFISLIERDLVHVADPQEYIPTITVERDGQPVPPSKPHNGSSDANRADIKNLVDMVRMAITVRATLIIASRAALDVFAYGSGALPGPDWAPQSNVYRATATETFSTGVQVLLEEVSVASNDNRYLPVQDATMLRAEVDKLHRGVEEMHRTINTRAKDLLRTHLLLVMLINFAIIYPIQIFSDVDYWMLLILPLTLFLYFGISIIRTFLGNPFDPSNPRVNMWETFINWENDTLGSIKRDFNRLFERTSDAIQELSFGRQTITIHDKLNEEGDPHAHKLSVGYLQPLQQSKS